MDDWDSDSRQEDLALADDGRLILSASSVTTFLRCGVQWEFAYVKALKSAPTIKQSLGIAAHEAFEANMLGKLVAEVDMPEAFVLDVFSGAYDRLLLEVEDPAEDPGKAKDQGVRLIQKQHREVAPGITPVLVEAPIQFEIDGMLYSGTIDLTDSKKRVRDWKTSARKPTDGGTYSIGMTGYALGYRALTGETETDVQLDFFVRYKKQAPAYYPIPAGGPVSDRAIAVFADVVARVYEAISAGRFTPNGLTSGACSWCGYREICRYYQQQR